MTSIAIKIDKLENTPCFLLAIILNKTIVHICLVEPENQCLRCMYGRVHAQTVYFISLDKKNMTENWPIDYHILH